MMVPGIRQTCADERQATRPAVPPANLWGKSTCPHHCPRGSPAPGPPWQQRHLAAPQAPRFAGQDAPTSPRCRDTAAWRRGLSPPSPVPDTGGHASASLLWSHTTPHRESKRTEWLWVPGTIEKSQRGVCREGACRKASVGKRSVGKRSGAAEGIRTPDPRITNAVLYQLSYRGLARCVPQSPRVGKVRIAQGGGVRATPSVASDPLPIAAAVPDRPAAAASGR
jgi:hypothetical protein